MKWQITTRRSACIRSSWSCIGEAFNLEQPGKHANFVDIAKSWLLDGVVPPSDRHHFPVALERLVESMLGLPARYKDRGGDRREGTKSFIGIAGQIAASLGLAAGTRDVAGKLFGTLERL